MNPKVKLLIFTFASLVCFAFVAYAVWQLFFVPNPLYNLPPIDRES